MRYLSTPLSKSKAVRHNSVRQLNYPAHSMPSSLSKARRSSASFLGVLVQALLLVLACHPILLLALGSRLRLRAFEREQFKRRPGKMVLYHSQ